MTYTQGDIAPTDRADVIARRAMAILRQKIVQMMLQAEESADTAATPRDQDRYGGEADGYACVIWLIDHANDVQAPALDTRVINEAGEPVASVTVCEGAFTITRNTKGSTGVILTREISGSEIVCIDQLAAADIAGKLMIMVGNVASTTPGGN